MKQLDGERAWPIVQTGDPKTDGSPSRIDTMRGYMDGCSGIDVIAVTSGGFRPLVEIYLILP